MHPVCFPRTLVDLFLYANTKQDCYLLSGREGVFIPSMGVNIRFLILTAVSCYTLKLAHMSFVP